MWLINFSLSLTKDQDQDLGAKNQDKDFTLKDQDKNQDLSTRTRTWANLKSHT